MFSKYVKNLKVQLLVLIAALTLLASYSTMLRCNSQSNSDTPSYFCYYPEEPTDS